MKGQVAASAVALASLAREGWRGKGDLIFIAAADEEVGDGFGLAVACEEHPEAVRADYSVNEGGGERVEIGGRAFYLCADRREDDLAVRAARPRPERPCVDPGIADNALVKAARLHRAARAVLAGAAADSRDRGLPRRRPRRRARLPATRCGRARGRPARRRADRAAPRGDRHADDGARASETRNIIPAVCDVRIDCRLLPGQEPGRGQRAIRELLGPGDYELRACRARGGTRSRGEGRCGTPSSRSLPPRSRARVRHPCASRASPTRTGCARRSARPRTGSSRPARWIPSWRPGSSTRRTSACRSGISSSASAGCATPRAPSAATILPACWSCTRRAAPSRRSRHTSHERLRPGLVADLYLGYGLSRAAAARSAPGAARAVPAAAPRLPCPARGRAAPGAPRSFRIGEWERSWTADEYAAGVEAVRAAIARGDVYQVNLVQHLSAPFARRSRRPRSRRSRRCGRCRPRRSSATGGRSSRRRQSSSSRGAATGCVTMPIKGTRPAGEDVDDAEGRRRARDDRRPRAERPLARLRYGHASAGPS